MVPKQGWHKVRGLWAQVFPRSVEFRLLCSGWSDNEAPEECFSYVTFAEPVPRSQHESHPRFFFFSIYGCVILHEPAAELHISGVFRHCFSSLGLRMG